MFKFKTLGQKAEINDNLDVNEIEIIDIINKIGKKTNTVLIPYGSVVEEAISNGFYYDKEVSDVVEELNNQGKLHIIYFKNYNSHAKKYNFESLIEGIKKKKYIITQDNLQDAYKEIANKILINNFENNKGKNKYIWVMENLFKTCGFSENETYNILDIALENAIKNVGKDILIEHLYFIIKLKILKYLENKEENSEYYLYKTLKESLYNNEIFKSIKKDNLFYSYFKRSTREMVYRGKIADIYINNSSDKINKIKYIILKEDEEHFFVSLLQKYLNIDQNHISINGKKIDEDTFKDYKHKALLRRNNNQYV